MVGFSRAKIMRALRWREAWGSAVAVPTPSCEWFDQSSSSLELEELFELELDEPLELEFEELFEFELDELFELEFEELFEFELDELLELEFEELFEFELDELF